MKKTILILFACSLIFTACKKEQGCMDAIATNYNADAEEDDELAADVVDDESLEDSSSPPQPIANNIIEIIIIEMINFMDLTIYPPITCF